MDTWVEPDTLGVGKHLAVSRSGPRTGLRLRRGTSFPAVLAILGTALAGCSPGGGEGPAPVLDAARPHRAEIAAGETHRYEVQGAAGHTLRIELDQGNVDLVAQVRVPGSDGVAGVDGRDHGIETITIALPEAGRVALSVTMAPGGRRAAYTVSLAERPTPTTRSDRARARAERLSTEVKTGLQSNDPGARKRAVDALPGLLAAARALPDRALEALTLAATGDVAHAGGDLEGAEANYRPALALARELRNTRLTAELVNNLGVLDWRRGRLAAAKLQFDEALQAWRAIGYRRGEASTLTNAGNLAFESAVYQDALEAFASAAEIFRVEGDNGGLAYALNNTGVTYLALSDAEEARKALAQAVARFQEVRDVAGERRAHLRLAAVHLARAEPDLALAERDAARALALEGSDPIGEADSVDLAGVIAAARGDWAQAIGHHQRAREQYRTIGSLKGEATALHRTGVALAGAGRWAEALEPLRRAVAIRRGIGLQDAEAESLHLLARANRHAGHVKQAMADLAAARAIAETVRGRVAGEYSRRSYFAARQTIYADSIDLLMAQAGPAGTGPFAAEALTVSERQRARSLLDTLEESSTDVRLGVDPALLRREQELREEMNLWSYRLAAVSNLPSPMREAAAEVRATLDARVSDYRRVEAEIRSASRGYAALEGAAPQTAADIQRSLDDDGTTLLRFSLGSPHSYLWLVTRRTLRAVRLPHRTAIETAARRVHALVQTSHTETGAAAWHEAARTLATMLFGPVAEPLGERRLIVVPEGSLQLVPFAALPEPGADTPLVVRHELVVLPSASTLSVLRRRHEGRERPTRTLAIVADPVYDHRDPRLTSQSRSEESQPGVGLGRLRFSGVEAKWISSFVPAAQAFVATGFAVTPGAMFDALGEYRVVHIAAHTMLDDERPELSALALSQFDARGRPRDDGFLRLFDIQERLRLRADLVVASACETAFGTEVPGEALMSLARGFFAAGSARVVASVYRVPDAATAQLMREFYRGMFGPNPLPPAAALRAAQVRLLETPQWRAPYYWSGFELLGEPR